MLCAFCLPIWVTTLGFLPGFEIYSRAHGTRAAAQGRGSARMNILTHCLPHLPVVNAFLRFLTESNSLKLTETDITIKTLTTHTPLIKRVEVHPP